MTPHSSSTRTFYYALGGGLGHLTRSLAIVHTLPVEGPVRLVTSLTPEFRRLIIDLPPQVELVVPPTDIDPSNRTQVADWINRSADEFFPEQVFIDCFPFGILGELDEKFLPGIPKTLVTRRVNWTAYRKRCPPRGDWPNFEIILATESLLAEQSDLQEMASEIVRIELKDFISPATSRHLEKLANDLGIDHTSTLVVHSGTPDETARILQVAIERTPSDGLILLISPSSSCPTPLPENVHHRECYPVFPLFDRVRKIVTAAGANSTRQLASLRKRHISVALDRPLDNQAQRTIHHNV